MFIHIILIILIVLVLLLLLFLYWHPSPGNQEWTTRWKLRNCCSWLAAAHFLDEVLFCDFRRGQEAFAALLLHVLRISGPTRDRSLVSRHVQMLRRRSCMPAGRSRLAKKMSAANIRWPTGTLLFGNDYQESTACREREGMEEKPSS